MAYEIREIGILRKLRYDGMRTGIREDMGTEGSAEGVNTRRMQNWDKHENIGNNK